MFKKMYTSSVVRISIFISILYFWCGNCANSTTPVSPTNKVIMATPTIVARSTFDANKDSVAINKCISSKDIRGVALILASRTDKQRQQIKISYQQNYATSLEQELQGKTKKTFERLMNALLQPLPEFLARQIGWSLDQEKNWEYMSIICTSSGQMINQFVAQYFTAYNKRLWDDLGSYLNDPNGINFLRAVIDSTSTNVTAPMRTNPTVRQSSIANQMTFFPRDYGRCYEVDNQLLFGFMSTESFAQIKAVVEAFQKANTLSVAGLINTYCFYDLREAYSRIVRFSVDPAAYWANEIYESMAGKQTDDRALTLAILSRSEIDLATIRDTFGVLYHQPLQKAIQDRCSGTYQEIMIQIVNGN
ncbi:hypothetical protein LSTR_LSTR011123 [Laodelphax striatellus]|uniref:Annexin n=1 Tax=Laodelphax striatellus TaxID=195883 RepID=A0A482XI38_LAOST|nr:hypothetical protein LSTR_LSTR011123 [Laodelphax striatellus]